MSLLTELKRRKVVRVGIVYAAGAFVALQAADLILPRLGVPEWAMSLVVVLLLLGLPLALALAWALELTPEGVRVTPRADPAGAAEERRAAAPSLFGRRTLALSGLLVAMGIGLGFGAGRFLSPDAGPAAAAWAPAEDELIAADADRSIAVLPFADFSPERDQEWFSDGLTEEILNALARLPDMRVASRSAAFRYRGSDEGVQTIAAALGVAHVLEGSVRRAGDRVRITAQLVRASDGAHLWSQNFDRDAADVIRIQEEIAFEIARTMRTALEPEALRQMVAAGTNSVAAYEAYLRGQHLWRQPAVEALAAFEEALSHDPQFSDAHRMAADFWLEQLMPTIPNYQLADVPYRERERRVAERAHAAAATAPDDYRRLRAEAIVAQLELRLGDAYQLMRRAAELQPGGWEVWWYTGILAVMVGEDQAARELMRRATELAGDDSEALAMIAGWTHDLETAAGLAERAVALDPLNAIAVAHASRLRAQRGRVEEAAAMADRFEVLEPRANLVSVVRIRQACAEGRVADAAAIYEQVVHTLDEASRWRALMLLGRHAEATELLRPRDRAGELFALASYLYSPHFDPRPYPNLDAALRRQGIEHVAVEIPFACPAAPSGPAGGAPR